MRSSERNRLARAAGLARAVAADERPPHSRPTSPRRPARPPLPACPVRRAYQKQTYRGAADPSAAPGDLRRVLGPARVLDDSTPRRVADRAVTPDLIDRVQGRLGADAILDGEHVEQGQLVVGSAAHGPSQVSVRRA